MYLFMKTLRPKSSTLCILVDILFTTSHDAKIHEFLFPNLLTNFLVLSLFFTYSSYIVITDLLSASLVSFGWVSFFMLILF